MKKIILQGFATVILFFGSWYVLTKFDWIKVFNINQMTVETEQKLGEIFWEVFKKSDKEISNINIVNPIDSIVTKICISNNINRNKIKIHVLKNDEVNAFALPNSQLIIYSGLILKCDNQDELAGVICHEIAHIELNHVLKTLVKEIGLSVLISMTTGNSGTDAIKEVAKLLSSLAFERSLEKEADIQAVNYMVNAEMNPESFADFLYKISESTNESSDYLTWLSSHPDSKERAEYVTNNSKDKSNHYKSVISAKTWDKLKLALID